MAEAKALGKQPLTCGFFLLTAGHREVHESHCGRGPEGTEGDRHRIHPPALITGAENSWVEAQNEKHMHRQKKKKHIKKHKKT